MPRAAAAYSSVPNRAYASSVRLEQLGVVVRHLLEVGHDPFGVDAVAVEAAAELVVDATARHAVEGAVEDAARRLARVVGPAVQQQRHRAGVRKLGAPSESAVHRIEYPGHLGDRVLEHLERRLAGRGLVQVVAHHAPHRLRLRLHLSAPRAIGVEHALEHGAEAGPAMRAVGREVGAAVEHLAGGREKRRQRPAALPGQRLHRPLVAGVDVRPLVPVHLDADEVLVQELGERRILVGLAVHHVAPVAPDGADVEQHRAVLRAGGREGLVAPGIPVDGLMGGGLEVGRGGGPEAVGGHRWLVVIAGR